MKKIIISLLLSTVILTVFSQPISNRSSGAVTTQDVRLAALYNFLLPRFDDTTQANLSQYIGLDSCGAVIFTRNNNSVWKRNCSPKKWELVGSAGAGTVTSVATTNGYAMLSSVSNPTLAANILLSVDSAALSAKYLRRADSTLYVTQKKLNDTAAAIRANMGSGTDSASYHTTTQITDSSFSLNRPNGTSDTIVIAGTDTSSLSNRINLKLNISDTSSMLSAYRTAINTNTSNIALKLNITDTVNIRSQLIAGTNVTITGTYPSLTIAASGGSSGWGLTGNAITAGQFVGTTNNTSFRLHSNGILRILADSIGKVFIDSIYVGRGIGTKYNNIAIGDSTLQRNTTGNGNTAIGDSALQLNTSGFDNTAIGNKAGRAITSNGGNTFVGSNAGLAVNSIGNTAVGNEALKAAAGNFNTALGFYALRANAGANNVAVGINSLVANTSGSGNIAIGYNAAAANLTGSSIVVIGNQAVPLGTGSYTTAVGASTLQNLTTGVANSCFGAYTGWGITTGSYNVIIGGQASALPGSRSNYVIINDGQGNAALTRDSLYRTGLGTITTPTALLHIAAGTTTIAPIKLTSGTNLTTPEAGTIEYNGTNLFFTPASAARNSVLITASVNTVSPTSPDRTITVVINGTTYYLAAKTTND